MWPGGVLRQGIVVGGLGGGCGCNSVICILDRAINSCVEGMKDVFSFFFF